MEKYTKKEVLEMYPLELSLPPEESRALREILKEANECHVLIWEESEGVKTDVQYTDFKITCGTTSFAHSYFRFGILYTQKVLPIWNNRHKPKKNKNETSNRVKRKTVKA